MRENKKVLRALSLGIGLTILACNDNKKGGIVEINGNEKLKLSEKERNGLSDAEIALLEHIDETNAETLMDLFWNMRVSNTLWGKVIRLASENGQRKKGFKVFWTLRDKGLIGPHKSVKKWRSDQEMVSTFNSVCRELSLSQCPVVSFSGQEKGSSILSLTSLNINATPFYRSNVSKKLPQNFSIPIFEKQELGVKSTLPQNSSVEKIFNVYEEAFLDAARKGNIEHLRSIYSEHSKDIGYPVLQVCINEELGKKCSTSNFFSFFECRVFPNICRNWKNNENYAFLDFLVSKSKEIESLYGRGPLYWCFNGFWGRRKKLDREKFPVFFLEKKIDINAQNKTGGTLLHFVSALYDCSQVEFLIGNGAKVNIVDNCGNSPLHSAVETGSLDICRFLIDNGAKVNIVDNCGNSPLHFAVRRGDLDICRLLISKGADVNILNFCRKSPLDLAKESGVKEMIDIISGEQAR